MKIFYITVVFMLGFISATVINQAVLPAKAEILGMDYYDLKSDRDFKKAVQYIVEECKVTDKGIRC